MLKLMPMNIYDVAAQQAGPSAPGGLPVYGLGVCGHLRQVRAPVAMR